MAASQNTSPVDNVPGAESGFQALDDWYSSEDDSDDNFYDAISRQAPILLDPPSLQSFSSFQGLENALHQ